MHTAKDLLPAPSPRLNRTVFHPTRSAHLPICFTLA
jgi:hypothetical protein